MITINNFYDVVTNKHHNEEDWLNGFIIQIHLLTLLRNMEQKLKF